MGLKPQICVGQIARVHFGPHIEPAPVIGLPHIAKKLGHLAQRPASVGQSSMTAKP